MSPNICSMLYRSTAIIAVWLAFVPEGRADSATQLHTMEMVINTTSILLLVSGLVVFLYTLRKYRSRGIEEATHFIQSAPSPEILYPLGGNSVNTASVKKYAENMVIAKSNQTISEEEMALDEKETPLIDGLLFRTDYSGIENFPRKNYLSEPAKSAELENEINDEPSRVVDPITQAKVYVACGRNGLAISLLFEAMDQDEGNYGTLALELSKIFKAEIISQNTSAERRSYLRAQQKLFLQKLITDKDKLTGEIWNQIHTAFRVTLEFTSKTPAVMQENVKSAHEIEEPKVQLYY